MRCIEHTCTEQCANRCAVLDTRTHVTTCKLMGCSEHTHVWGKSRASLITYTGCEYIALNAYTCNKQHLVSAFYWRIQAHTSLCMAPQQVFALTCFQFHRRIQNVSSHMHCADLNFAYVDAHTIKRPLHVETSFH